MKKAKWMSWILTIAFCITLSMPVYADDVDLIILDDVISLQDIDSEDSGTIDLQNDVISESSDVLKNSDRLAERLSESDTETMDDIVDISDDMEEDAVEPSTAWSGKCGENATWTLDDQGILTISGEGEIVSPEWTENQRRTIKTANIGEGITGIGEAAFEGCSKLEHINLPKTLKTIGKMAFSYCQSLESISLPEGLEYIGSEAFIITKITRLIIPKSVRRIGGRIFSDGYGRVKARIFFRGDLPEFDDDEAISMPGKVALAYYPKDNKTWTSVSKESILIGHNPNSGNAEIVRFYNIIPYLGDAENAVSDISRCSFYYSDEIFNNKLENKEVAYNGKAWKPVFVVYDGHVKTSSGSDLYGSLIEDVDYTYTYKNNKNAGTASIIVTGIGDYYGTLAWTFTIRPKLVNPTLTLSANSYVYDGKTKKPSVTVKDGSKKLITADYDLYYSSGRKTPGLYIVLVKLKGNYQGTGGAMFTINPKATTISSVTAKSKQFTVKWKKQANQTTGYEIQYSMKKDFSSDNKTVIIPSNKTTSTTVKSLKASKTYYVRIRTYMTSDGEKYYSTWSKVKNVKVK